MDEQQEVSVAIEGYTYTPDTLVVKKGTVVTWTNNDTQAHSASADEGSFDTGLLEQGDSASVTLNEPGEYTYHCSLHPNMTGSIVVEDYNQRESVSTARSFPRIPSGIPLTFLRCAGIDRYCLRIL